MRLVKVWTLVFCSLASFALFIAQAGAQESVVSSRVTIVPQSRSFTAERRARIEITEVDVGVVILEQVATTTMDISIRNPGTARLESELLVPVPEGAVVRGFTFQGAAGEPTAQVLTKEEARKAYNAIVAKIRDPALLEFVGYNLIRSSVFPVEAGGTQKVRLTYEHILSADGERVDYVLVRSESLEYNVPWKIAVKIRAKNPISALYSPSHRLEVLRSGEKSVSAQITPDDRKKPGPFLLSYLIQRDGISASLFAYPDLKSGGGYFLLLAGLPARPEADKDEPAIKREVILVIDKSGSMRGEKLEQVREAAMQIIGGLKDGEAFNILTYGNSVDFFSKEPVLKSKESEEKAFAYLKDIRPSGGTNIHDALTEALRQKPVAGMLPIVLFLTDGLPTVGQTSEVAIRELATKGNLHSKRVFTFGVGVDVNTPLLDKIASETRATATFVLPGEDVEVKVSQVFKRLCGPVLTDAKIEVMDSQKKPSPARVRELIPDRLPDLFEGDQLVLLGQYVGEEPLTFSISGNYLGAKRTFEFTFSLGKATTRNSFVPRLWASRKIAVLIDAIRQLGADYRPATAQAVVPDDPRVRELTDEIVRLSVEFGILTEYTAFLAHEGTNIAERDEVLNQAMGNFQRRAQATRSGLSSVNQEMNNQSQQSQQELNPGNRYYDENMNRVEVANVQQIADKAFYKKGDRWVDSSLVEKEAKPKKVIEFGSEEFSELVQRLAKEGRQGSISLGGDILLVVDGEPVLVKGPTGK